MDTEQHKVKRSYRTLATGAEKAYMAIAAVEALVVVAVVFTGFGLVQANIANQNTTTRTVPVYLANFIFAQIFSLLYVFDALRARNIIQLVLHLFFNLCILVYSILQIPQTMNALSKAPATGCGSYPSCVGPGGLYGQLQKLYIVNPIFVGLATFAFVYLIRKLYVEFGWSVFHLVGASPEMKRMHKEYQTLLSLLKMIFFFATAFCIAYLILATNPAAHTADFVLAIVALALTPITILATGWAVRKEVRWLMAICITLMVAGLVYFIYKLASLWLPSTAEIYINTKITMAIFSIFAIISLMATFIYGCLCFSNFGKGLVQVHQNPENRSSLWALSSNTRYQEKVRADIEADQPRPDDRLVIE